MKKISIAILMASSFWGMAQERPELEEIVDPVGPTHASYFNALNRDPIVPTLPKVLRLPQ